MDTTHLSKVKFCHYRRFCMNRFTSIIVLLALVILVASCGKKVSEEELFTQAAQLQKEGKYNEAIDIYNQLIKKFPSGEFGAQSQFMIGFIYANELKDLENAGKAYQKFIDSYPNHEMVKDAHWELENLGIDINEIEELTTAPKDTAEE